MVAPRSAAAAGGASGRAGDLRLGDRRGAVARRQRIAATERPGPGTSGRRVASAELQSVAGDRYRITVFPISRRAARMGTGFAFSRNGQLASGGQAGGLYPTARDPIFGGAGVGYIAVGPQASASVASRSPVPRSRRSASTGARSVRSPHRSCPPATGWRCFSCRRGPAPVVAGLERITGGTTRVPAGPGLTSRRIRAAALIPLDAAGQVIPVSRSNLGGFPSTAFWQAPSAVTPTIHEPPYHGPTHPGPGACELGQSGLPGLTPNGDTRSPASRPSPARRANCCCRASTPTTTYTAGR